MSKQKLNKKPYKGSFISQPTKTINICPNCEQEVLTEVSDDFDYYKSSSTVFTDIPHKDTKDCIKHLRSLIHSLANDIDGINNKDRDY